MFWKNKVVARSISLLIFVLAFFLFYKGSVNFSFAAETCSQFYEVNGQSAPCSSLPIFNLSCAFDARAGYSGQECCTTGLGYQSCKNFSTTGQETASPPYGGFKCCSNVAPTPTPSPTPTPLPGVTNTPTPIPPTPIPTLSPAPNQRILSGHVFVDANQDGIRNNSELDYSSAITLVLSGSASYTITISYWARLVAIGGNYTLTLTAPSNYRITGSTVQGTAQGTSGYITISSLSQDTEINFGIVSVPTPIRKNFNP